MYDEIVYYYVWIYHILLIFLIVNGLLVISPFHFFLLLKPTLKQPLIYFLKDFNFSCVCVGVCAHECRCLRRPEEGILSLGDQVTGSYVWVLEMEFKSSARAILALNHLSSTVNPLVICIEFPVLDT